MSPRDPKSPTARTLKAPTAKPDGDYLETGKQNDMPNELRRWIDLVIVPILIERYKQEKETLQKLTDG